MNLRQTLVLTVPTANVSELDHFFRGIGFETVKTTPGILFTDGRISVLPDEKGTYKTGLLYPAEELDTVAINLKAKNLAFEMQFESEKIAAVSITDPNGISLTYLPKNFFNTVPKTTDKPLSACGLFYEISIKTERFAETVNFWENLGFKIIMGKPEHEKFVTLSDGTATIGIYNPAICPHVFNNPALTYFELKMGDCIQYLKEKGIKFRQELPNKDGVIEDAILESPDGLHVFLFKGWE